MGPAAMLELWAPAVASQIAASLMLPKVWKVLSSSQIAAVLNVLFLGSALCVHWGDFSSPVFPWRTGVGLCFWLFTEINVQMLVNIIINQRLLPWQQAKYQSILNVFSQLGRFAGPIVVTQVLAMAKRRDRDSAVNVTFAVLVVLRFVGYAIPWPVWNAYFGKWRKEPPPGAGAPSATVSTREESARRMM